MLVKNWMSKDVITVDVNDSMQYAARLMKKIIWVWLFYDDLKKH